MLKSLFSLILVLSLSLAFPQNFNGDFLCSKILDGNTIVINNGQEYNIKVFNDPDPKNESLIAKLEFLVIGKQCRIYPQKIQGNNIEALVFIDNVCLNETLKTFEIPDIGRPEGIAYSYLFKESSTQDLVMNVRLQNVRWFTNDMEFNQWAINWRRIIPGMSPEEVIRILGETPVKLPIVKEGNFNTEQSADGLFTNLQVDGKTIGEIYQSWIIKKPKDFQIYRSLDDLIRDSSFHFEVYYKWNGKRWVSYKKEVHLSWYKYNYIKEGFRSQNVTNEF